MAFSSVNFSNRELLMIHMVQTDSHAIIEDADSWLESHNKREHGKCKLNC